MGILEYATVTVPDVAKRDVLAFFNAEPLWKRLKSSNKVVRSGGTQVRIIRVMSEHSTTVQLDGSNLTIPANKKPTLEAMTGDWAKYGKAIVLPHTDTERMQTKDEKKRYVKAMTDAAVQSLMNDFVRQMYIGSMSNLLGFATFHGSRTTGTSSGFVNGALQFVTPANQQVGALTYLNSLRLIDTVNEVNNWHNQCILHGGIGSNFLKTVERIKGRADTFDPGEGGISLGICSIDDLSSIGDECRAYPGGSGGTGVVYSPQDAASGKIHKLINSAGGVDYFANRFMTASNMGLTEPCYLLNPDWIELWVNANHDFQVGPFVDRLKTTGEDADVANILVEIQLAVPNLMANGATAHS